MTRQQILDQISETLGSVPGWLGSQPDPHLEQMQQLGAVPPPGQGES